MRRFLKFFLVLTVVLSCFPQYIPTTQAAGIRIESGNFDSIDGWSQRKGTSLYISRRLPENTVITIEYTVNAPSDGAYSLIVQSNPAGVDFCCDYYCQINGGDAIEAAGKPILTRVNDTNFVYDLGYVYLKKGKNTLKVVCPSANTLNGNHTFWISYFEFRPVSDRAIYEAIGNADFNTWVYGESTVFDLSLSKKEAVDRDFYFIIKDYWDRPVLDGNFTVEKMTDKYKLYLGNLECGWYSVEIGGESDGGRQPRQPLIQQQMSVVARPESRDYPSMLSFDVFNSIRSWSQQQKVEGYNTAKRAGIDVARERFMVGDAWQKGEINFSRTEHVFKAAKKVGLEVMPIFQGLPNWMTEPNSKVPTDLFDVYNMTRRTAERLNGVVNYWEYQNEVDLETQYGTADVYAAQCKAGLLGFNAGNPDAVVAMSSMALYPSDTKFYYDLLMQNDVMRYSSFFNFHRYNALTGDVDFVDMPTRYVDAMTNLSYMYDAEDKPIWSTESSTNGRNDTAPSGGKEEKTIIPGARSNVIQAVVQQMRGEQLYTYFSYSNYKEGNTVFGLFDPVYQPYPVFSAMTVLNNVLGRAIPAGVLDNLPDKVTGYLFDTGKQHTAVLWSGIPSEVTLKTKIPVTVVDVMGGRSVRTPTDGAVTVLVYADPVYVEFAGKADIANYYPVDYKEREMKPVHFTDTDKVVLYPKVDNFTRAELNAAFNTGYEFEPGGSKKVSLEVYNFNSKPMEGTINAVSETGYSVYPSESSVKIQPMSKVVLNFTITAAEDVRPNVLKLVKFSGNFGEDRDTISSLGVICKYTEPVVMSYMLKGADDPANYRRNQGVGSTQFRKSSIEGGIEYTVNGETDWWFPYFRVQGGDEKIFDDYDGVVVTTYTEKEFEQGQTYMFVYHEDCEVVKFAQSLPDKIGAGYTQFKIPWNKFNRFDGPVPVLFLTDIAYIAFGISGIVEDGVNLSVVYGLYKEDIDDAVTIGISGVENGGTYSPGSLKVNITLPNNPDIVPEKTRILLMDKEHDYRFISGSEIEADMSGLKKGFYKMLVVAYTKNGNAVHKQMEFYIK